MTVGVTFGCLNMKLKGANMEGIYLYKDKVEEINQMIDELGVSL